MPASFFDSIESLKTFLLESSENQFQNVLPQFSLSELTESFVLLQTQPALEAKSKLEKLFQFIDSPTTLETIGEHFSVSSFLSFLEFLTQHSHYQHALSFVLIGIDPLIFSQALHFLEETHLDMLKQEGLLEPLQYQLTQFVHEGEALKQHMEQVVEKYQQELTSIHPKELTQDMLQALIDHINYFRNQLLDYLEKARSALAIVWHTNRIDLIDKLSSITEIIQHQLILLIGHPRFDHLPATGLYSFLEQIFSSIFDSALQDEDAAIEGMTQLSIWHLKDYWELGLLPCIHHLHDLDLDAKKHSIGEQGDHHDLKSLVQNQLERLGIRTVGDLKKLHLFSKSLLKTYIEQHHHLLVERKNKMNSGNS